MNEITVGLIMRVPIKKDAEFVNPQTGETFKRTVTDYIDAKVSKVEGSDVTIRFASGTERVLSL